MADVLKLKVGLDNQELDADLRDNEKKVEAFNARLTRAARNNAQTAGTAISSITQILERETLKAAQSFGSSFHRETFRLMQDAQRLAEMLRFQDALAEFQRRTRAAFRDFISQAVTGARGAEEALRSRLSGSVFDRLKAKAGETFAAIREKASGLFSGLGGGGSSGGGGGLLSTVLGFAGGGILGSAVTSIFGGLLDQIKGIASAGLDFNSTIESAEISLKRLLGSSQAARAEIERLKKDALAAPIDFTQLLELDQRLLNARFSVKLLEKDFVGFTQGTALLTGTKGLTDRLDGITTALSQMSQKGRVSNEELSQLAERQLPIYKLLGDAIGKTTDEVFRLAESGQLDGLKTAELIFKSLSKEAANVGDEVKNSFAVLSSNFSDLQQQAAGRATQGLFRDAKDLLQLATGADAQRIITNIAGGFDTLESKVSGGFRAAFDVLKSGNLFDLGKQAVEGLTQGIATTAQSAWDKAKELGGGVLDTVKRVLEIESPSKRMRELGQFAADGFTEGLIDRTSEGFRRWAKQIEKIGGEEFIKAVEAVARKVGANPNDLLGVFAFESRLNPATTNGIGATGLIQFLKKTARDLGTSTDSLRQQTAVDQLAYVEKYLLQFGKVLDTTEKLYSAVLRGRVLSDPDRVLFREGTKAYAQNPLDFDKSGTVTLREAASQITKQGFTTPGRGGFTIPGGEVITEIRAAVEAIPLNLDRINAGLNGLPQQATAIATATQHVTQQTVAATTATAGLGNATYTAAEQAANFANVWKNPLLADIKKAEEALKSIGQFLPEKERLAQLEALREIKQADEDAHLSMIKNRVRLADATVYHAERANAGVLEYLAQQTRGITELVRDAKTGVIDSLFGAADQSISRLTSRLGIFKNVVADILSGLARLALSPILGGLLGGTGARAAGGFSLGGFGPGGTAPFNPSSNSGGGGFFNFVRNAFGFGGGGSSNSSLPTPPSITAGNGPIPTISRAEAGLEGVGLSNDTALARAAGAGNPSFLARLFGGAGGALLPFLGAGIGSSLGGQSTLGQIAGLLGGGAVGLGISYGASVFGALGGGFGALGPAALAALGPAALIGAPLIAAAILLGRAKQRRTDEATSGDSLQRAIDEIKELKRQADTGQLTSIAQAESSFTAIHRQFINETLQLKTKSVRESRLNNQGDITPPLHPDSLRALFERETLPAVIAANRRRGVFDRLLPEFDTGGLIPRTGPIYAHERELILNLKQQRTIAGMAGSDVFVRAGVPNAPTVTATPSPTVYTAGNRSSGGESLQPIVIHVEKLTLNVSREEAGRLVAEGLETNDGRKVFIKTANDAKLNRDIR